MTRRKSAPVEISFAAEKLDWFAFRVYVYAFWSIAAARTESRPKLRKMRERLLAMLDGTPAVGPITAKAPATYDPNEHQLFLNPTERQRVTGLNGNSARLYFAPYRDFAKLLHSYGDDHTRGTHLDLSTIDPVDRNHLRDFGWTAQTVPDRGVVVVDSNDNGASIWITADRASAGFSKEAGYAASEYLPVVSAVGNWLDRVDIEPVTFTASLARDALTLLVAQHDLPIPAPSVDTDVLIIDTTTGRSELSKRFNERVSSHVWVFTKNEKLTLRQCRQLNAARLRHVVVVTHDVILGLLRAYPWLWSKYFGAAVDFAVVQNTDDERLGALILPSWTMATRERFRSYVESAVAAAAPAIAAVLALEPRFPRRECGDIPECSQRVYALAHHVDGWLQERLVHKSLCFADAIFRSLGRYRAEEHDAWIAEFTQRGTAAILREYDREFFPIAREHAQAHPLLGDFKSFVSLRGRSQSGKSTALYHAARSQFGHKRGVVVLGARTRGQRLMLVEQKEDLDLLARMIASVACEWTIVFEGMELESGRSPADTTLARLLTIADKQNAVLGQPRVRVIATVPHEETDADRSTYRQVRPRIADLDILDADLVRVLLDTWVGVYNVRIAPDMLERLRTAFTAAVHGDDAHDLPADFSLWTVGAIVSRLRRISDTTVTSTDIDALLAIPPTPRTSRV